MIDAVRAGDEVVGAEEDQARHPRYPEIEERQVLRRHQEVVSRMKTAVSSIGQETDSGPVASSRSAALIAGPPRASAIDLPRATYKMSSVRFEWDEGKNLANKGRHGVSFEEAAELFTSTVDFLEIFDEAHSDLEDRMIAIGPISRGLVLVVWTERSGDVVRIISARWASKNEEQLYFSYKELSP